MIPLKRWLALWFCWVALVSQGHGQDLPAQSQQPPVFGILDEGGLFSRDSGGFKRISDQLQKLEKDHGYKIFLVVDSVLIAISAPERAAELLHAWVPDGNGLVVVFESDSRNLGIGRDMAGNPELTNNPARVPSHETTAMLNRAMESADPNQAPETFLEALMGNLVGEFDGYFNRRATPPPVERSVKIGLLVAGVLALLGLAAIGLGGLVRHSSMAGVRSFRFPVVDRPERLGAPCGGNVTARRFAPFRERT